MHRCGHRDALTDEEFQAAKKRLLAAAR